MQFSPSVYEHAARLIGRTPWEVSRDGGLMREAHAEAYRLYRHSPVVVGIDIYNLEAEAYGARVARPEETGIPAVSEHIATSSGDILALPHFDPSAAGRIPMALDAAGRLKRDFPEADVRVPVSGPFSIAASLAGFENLLCEALSEPERLREALTHLARGQVGFARAVAARGLDIAFFESAAAPPLLSPEMFKEIELPALKTALDGAAQAVGHPVPCVIGGDTLPILDSILSTGTGYVICPCETDQAAFMRRMASRPEVMVRVNTRPDIVAAGRMDEVRRELDRVMVLARARERSCIGTGALPYETRPDVVLAMREHVEREGR